VFLEAARRGHQGESPCATRTPQAVNSSLLSGSIRYINQSMGFSRPSRAHLQSRWDQFVGLGGGKAETCADLDRSRGFSFSLSCGPRNPSSNTHMLCFSVGRRILPTSRVLKSGRTLSVPNGSSRFDRSEDQIETSPSVAKEIFLDYIREVFIPAVENDCQLP
jgi:hypothetical protein